MLSVTSVYHASRSTKGCRKRHSVENPMRKAMYASLVFGSLLASNAYAQNAWSANTATGVPNFQSTGVVKTPSPWIVRFTAAASGRG